MVIVGLPGLLAGAVDETLAAIGRGAVEFADLQYPARQGLLSRDAVAGFKAVGTLLRIGFFQTKTAG